MRSMPCWTRLWRDDAGFVISSEAVLVGTVGVLGATVGLTAVGQSVNEELKELAFAFRSLDQSYSIPGHSSCGAWTAGSEYMQRDVQEAIAGLCATIDSLEQSAEEQHATPPQEEKQKAEQKKEARKKKEAERQQREQQRKERETSALSA